MEKFPLNGLSRRRFLQTGGAAALGLARFPAMLTAKEEKDDTFGGFNLGMQSYTFRKFTLEQALKRTQDLGLHYIEFYNGHVPTDSDADKIKAVLKLCREYEIKPIAFGVERFTKNHDQNKRLFEFGKALGIKTLSADPEPDSFRIQALLVLVVEDLI